MKRVLYYCSILTLSLFIALSFSPSFKAFAFDVPNLPSDVEYSIISPSNYEACISFSLDSFEPYVDAYSNPINHPFGVVVPSGSRFSIDLYFARNLTRYLLFPNGSYYYWAKGYNTYYTYVSYSNDSVYDLPFPIFLNSDSAFEYARTGFIDYSDTSNILYLPSSFHDPYSYDEFLSYDYRRHNLSLSSPYVGYFGNLLRNNHLSGTTLDFDMSVVLPYSRYVTWMHDTIVDYYGGNISLTLEDVHGYFQSQVRPDSWADLKYNYSSPIELHRSDVRFGQAFDADSPSQGDYGFSFGYTLSDIGLSDSVDSLITFYLSFPYRVSVYQGSDYFGTCEWYPSYSSSLTTEGAFPLKPFQPIIPIPEDSPAISVPSDLTNVDDYFVGAGDLFNYSNPSALAFFVGLVLLVPAYIRIFAFVVIIIVLGTKFFKVLLSL